MTALRLPGQTGCWTPLREGCSHNLTVVLGDVASLVDRHFPQIGRCGGRISMKSWRICPEPNAEKAHLSAKAHVITLRLRWG
jgi:hypothetical protein